MDPWCLKGSQGEAEEAERHAAIRAAEEAEQIAVKKAAAEEKRKQDILNIFNKTFEFSQKIKGLR